MCKLIQQPKLGEKERTRSFNMRKVGSQRHGQWLKATKKKQNLVPRDMGNSSAQQIKARVPILKK